MMMEDSGRRNVDREKALFLYATALDRGDFAVVAALLRDAEDDPALERMIMEHHEAQELAVQQLRTAVYRKPRRLLGPAGRSSRGHLWEAALSSIALAGVTGAALMTWHLMPPVRPGGHLVLASREPAVADRLRGRPGAPDMGSIAIVPRPPAADGRTRGHMPTQRRSARAPALTRQAPTRLAAMALLVHRAATIPVRTRAVQTEPAIALPLPGFAGSDMSRLDEGLGTTPVPWSPPLAPIQREHLSVLQVRPPGSTLADDLLLLNPVQVAGSDEAAVRAAAHAVQAQSPTTDGRLQRKVWVRFTGLLSELLARLSRATGVSMTARMEVADEPVTLWESGRTLMDVMRDVRHLHGYYWSRFKRRQGFVYQLWQDAAGRAREAAKLQAKIMAQQRAFANSIQRRIKALDAGEDSLKRLAQQDPFLVAQMKDPAISNACRLFATLSPDQQAQLTWGQAPGRPAEDRSDGLLFPDKSRKTDPWVGEESYSGSDAQPRGDVVALSSGDLTAQQRDRVMAVLRGAEAEDRRMFAKFHQRDPRHASASDFWRADAAASADPATVHATFFRTGDAESQSLTLRIDFSSHGRPWVFWGTPGPSLKVQRQYNEMLRSGLDVLRHGRESVAPYLKAAANGAAARWRAPADTPAHTGPPDPVLDAPVTVDWPMRRHGSSDLVSIGPNGICYSIEQTIHRPIVLDTPPAVLRERQDTGQALLKLDHRPLRELLARLFPGREISESNGTLFVRGPNRLLDRLNAVPPSVVAMLKSLNGPMTLDTLSLLARWLTPQQIARLPAVSGLTSDAIDQMLAVQELLQFYGDMAPAHHVQISQGLDFAAMTPAEQQWFLRFAERQRPGVEPWRFQDGRLRIRTGPPPPPDPKRAFMLHSPYNVEPQPIGRVTFDVRFEEGDVQSYPLDLYPMKPAIYWPDNGVGKPFDARNYAFFGIGRHQPLVSITSSPFAMPYTGTDPPPDLDAWVRRLARDLRPDGVVVTQQLYAMAPEKTKATLPDNLHRRITPGFYMYAGSPQVLIVDRNEVFRRLFKGQDALDLATVERAARDAAKAPAVPASAGKNGG